LHREELFKGLDLGTVPLPLKSVIKSYCQWKQTQIVSKHYWKFHLTFSL